MNIPTFGIGILADDVPATVAFYRDFFAFEVRVDLGWFVTLGHGESPYELSVVERTHESNPESLNRVPGGGIIGLVVPDATALYKRLETAGAGLHSGIKDEPWGQRHFFVTDPAGFMIDAIEVTTPSPEWMAANGVTDQVAG